MTRVLEFLLGLNRIDLSKGGQVEFRFLSAWPAWVAFLAIVAGVVYVWNIYRRESPGTPGGPRVLLFVLRSLIVILALVLIFEPALVLVKNNTIKSSVVVMIDRSESMTVADGNDTVDEQTARTLMKRAGLAAADPSRPTRFELARAMLGADQAAWLKRLAVKQRVHLYAFDGSPQPLTVIDSPEQVDAALAELDDQAARKGWFKPRSAPAASMERVLEELAGQTVTGLVVLSDARGTADTQPDRLKSLAEARAVPLLVVGLGSMRRPKDLELNRVDAKRWSFVDEKPLVKVTFRNQGLEGESAELQLRVKDKPELDITKPVVLARSGVPQTIDLRIDADQAGTYEVTVSLTPLAGEFDEANNTHLPIKIDVLDRKPKVLLIEDLPRWEYQYLKNALYRDRTVQLSVLLHSADPLFSPEGNLPIKRFPESRDALFEYDVIIIGDVDRRKFSVQQLEWIEQFVSEKGGGLIFIAGERFFNPNSYVGTPLETLVPVEPSDEQLAGNVSASWHPEMTIEGSVSPILKFDKNISANEEVWASLKPFYWYYQARRAKPGAQVLLTQPEDHNPYSPDGKFPIMVLQRVGAGRVFFSASDETWRWRYYTGRQYFNTFWLQLIRFLSLPQEEMSIDTGRPRYSLGDQVKVTMRLADRECIPTTLEEIKVTIRHTAEDGTPQIEDLSLQRTRPEVAVFETEFIPERSGKYLVAGEVASKRGKLSAMGEFTVAPSREEFRDPTRDQEFIDSLAGASEGSLAVTLGDLGPMLGRIVSRSRDVPDDDTDPIWDSPLALGLFVLLIATEWILRKKYRML